LTQKLSEYNVKRNFSSEDQIKNLKQVIIPSIELNITFESDDQVIKIEESRRSAKSYTFERSKLEKVQQVHYCLTTDKHEDQKILPVLIWLSKFLPNLKSVKFNFYSENSSSEDAPEHRVYSLLSATLSQPENLEKIEIYALDSNISDTGLIFLAEKVLPQVKNLKTFICDLNQTSVTGKVLQAFAQANFAAQQNLETLRLELVEASFKEEEVLQFLNTVPNVKDLLLGFGHTELTDQALEEFSTKILPSLNKVERLELGFWETKVTGAGINKFLMNVPSTVKQLLVGMQKLEVTDESIQSFLSDKLPSFSNLLELDLKLSETKVTQNIFQQISEWREKVVRKNEVSEEEFPFVHTQASSI